MKIDEDIVLIAGPTASGKTALAIEVAQANDAVIVNADSMQVYTDLKIITARPTAEETSLVPHHLFGHVDAAQHYSVAQWLDDVRQLLSALEQSGSKIVFVGGTGVYFNALIDGLSHIPPIDSNIREKWRSNGELNTDQLHELLVKMDPKTAETLRSSDRQRILRALEVFESTGKSLIDWQKDKAAPVLDPRFALRKLLLMPNRTILHERINQRFDRMVEEGALEEVEQLLTRQLSPELPAMKAIGVPQLASVVRGETLVGEAVEKAKAASRQYAKRQTTWFRNSFNDDWETL